MLYTSTVYMLIYSVTKNCNYKHTDFYNICAIFVRQTTFLCTVYVYRVCIKVTWSGLLFCSTVAVVGLSITRFMSCVVTCSTLH